MDVLIFVADGTIFKGVDYATRIEQRLSRAGLISARFDLTSLPMEHPRPKLAYVYTGGETSVHADVEWMRSAVDMTRRLIADAQCGGPSVIGICLGSQIIAEALRPDSIIDTHAIEIGLTPVTSPEAGQPGHVVPSFHYQAISPAVGTVADVRIELRNDHTAVQALSYGKRVFGCQFHPELTPADVLELIEFNAEVITTWHGDVDAARRSVERYADVFADDLFERLVVDRIRA